MIVQLVFGNTSLRVLAKNIEVDIWGETMQVVCEGTLRTKYKKGIEYTREGDSMTFKDVVEVKTF